MLAADFYRRPAYRGGRTRSSYQSVCLPHLDWVGMDLKAPFDLYDQITGIAGSGKIAEQSARLLRQSGVAHQFRTTVDPFFLSDARIEKMKQMVEGFGANLLLQQLVPR